MNRVFRGSTALLPFWQGGTGLSFVALFWKNGDNGGDSICSGDCGAVASTFASGGKTRYGPFVGFKKVFEFGNGIFKSCRIFENFKSYRNYRIYEGSCVA